MGMGNGLQSAREAEQIIVSAILDNGLDADILIPAVMERLHPRPWPEAQIFRIVERCRASDLDALVEFLGADPSWDLFKTGLAGETNRHRCQAWTRFEDPAGDRQEECRLTDQCDTSPGRYGTSSVEFQGVEAATMEVLSTETRRASCEEWDDEEWNEDAQIGAREELDLEKFNENSRSYGNEITRRRATFRTEEDMYAHD